MEKKHTGRGGCGNFFGFVRFVTVTKCDIIMKKYFFKQKTGFKDIVLHI